jgi:lipopolysaccharide transport system permease protein
VEEPVGADALAVRATPRRHGETVRIEKTRGFDRLLAPGELWRFRDTAFQIAARDVKVRYRQTLLGAAWAVLQPIGTMVVFSLFFGRLAHVSSGGGSYALFSLAGIVPWTYFSTTLLLSSESLVTNQSLVGKVYFPRIFIPAGVVAASLVDLSIAVVILLVIVAASGVGLSVSVLAIPLLVVVMVAAALGVGAGLAAVNVRYRDVRYIVPFALQLWLFATPIAYPSSVLHYPWRAVAAVNPMVGIVDGFRWAVLGRPSSPWTVIAISAVSAVVLLVGGLAYFDRVERRFADII